MAIIWIIMVVAAGASLKKRSRLIFCLLDIRLAARYGINIIIVVDIDINIRSLDTTFMYEDDESPLLPPNGDIKNLKRYVLVRPIITKIVVGKYRLLPR